MNNISKKAEEIICKKLKISKLDPEKDMRSIGLDSLDVVEILLTLEDELHVEFESPELKKLKKVKDLYDLIDAKTNALKK